VEVIPDEQGAVTGRSTGLFVGTMTQFRHAKRPHAFTELPTLRSLPD
jgi:hypothetical protein